MKKIILFCAVMAIVGCKNKTEEEVLTNDEITAAVNLPEKDYKFLWIKSQFNEEILDSIPSMKINQKYLKEMTEPEKAAVTYIATFIGNECEWDGGFTDDNTNLKCKILTTFDLGYQCSDEHLGFLRQWFEKDEPVLKELESDNCPTIPDTATHQNSFDEIQISVHENQIVITYQVDDINTRGEEVIAYTERATFEVVDERHIVLKKKEKV